MSGPARDSSSESDEDGFSTGMASGPFDAALYQSTPKQGKSFWNPTARPQRVRGELNWSVDSGDYVMPVRPEPIESPVSELYEDRVQGGGSFYSNAEVDILAELRDRLRDFELVTLRGRYALVDRVRNRRYSLPSIEERSISTWHGTRFRDLDIQAQTQILEELKHLRSLNP